MGYSLLRFVSAVDHHLRCPICSHALESPVLTPCGHTFCRPCLVTWLTESAATHADRPVYTSSFNRTQTPGSLHNGHALDITRRTRLVENPSLFSEDQSQLTARSDVHTVAEHAHHRNASHPEGQTDEGEGHSGTCPECRSPVCTDELSQVICVRNLVLSMEVKCENSDRGCSASFPLERSDHHLQTCEFVPVTCFGCEAQMDRSKMASHQQVCPALSRILDGSKPSGVHESDRNRRSSSLRDDEESYQDEISIDRRDSWLEAPGSSFDSMNTAAIRERSAILTQRRSCLNVSPRFESHSREIYSRNHDKRGSGNNFDFERSKTMNGRNTDVLVGTSNSASATLGDLTLARTSPSRSNESRALSPVGRSQAIQTTSHASLALAQAGCAAQVSRLLTRIGALETQVGKLLDDLQEANSKNSVLNIEYRRIQRELLVFRRNQGPGLCAENPKFLVNSEACHLSRVDIDQLSATLAQNLLAKPSYVDSTVVFRQLRSCYVDNFLSVSANESTRNAVHDLHVLLATAYASNWFSPAQRSTLGLWLQHVLLASGQGRLAATQA